MDGTEVALRVVGAFYTFAGLVTARAALTSRLLDQAISAISLKPPDRIDTHRTIWLVGLSVLMFAAGVTLMLLLAPAAWLFGVAAIIQALYFAILGPFYFDIADPPDPAGRRRSINAFVIFCAATAFVVWAAATGRLASIANASALLLGAAVAAVALQTGYVLRHMLFAPQRRSAFAGFDDVPADDVADDALPAFNELAATSRRIKLMTDYGSFPLWGMDDGAIGNFAPQDLGVSDELSADLWAWVNDFDMSFNPDDPATSRWSDERQRAHVEQGVALARRLKCEFPDREVFVHDTRGELVEIEAVDDRP